MTTIHSLFKIFLYRLSHSFPYGKRDQAVATSQGWGYQTHLTPVEIPLCDTEWRILRELDEGTLEWGAAVSAVWPRLTHCGYVYPRFGGITDLGRKAVREHFEAEKQRAREKEARWLATRGIQFEIGIDSLIDSIGHEDMDLQLKHLIEKYYPETDDKLLYGVLQIIGAFEDELDRQRLVSEEMNDEINHLTELLAEKKD